MDKIRDFFNKYCIKEILILFFISIFMLLLFYGKSESFLVDVGREAYVPWQMLKGNVLYKDIFNVYGPLSYQINALMYMLLGVKLSTLYIVGYLNAFLIIVLTFFITKMFTTRKLALCTSLIVVGSCLYIKTFFNFVFPYSYAAVYNLSGYIISVFAFLNFLKKGNKKLLYIAFFAAGFSFANKIEYLPYFVLLFFSLFFVKPKLKELLFCILSFLIVPFVSFGILIFQGVNLSDFYNAYLLIDGLLKTPATNFFYKSYGLYWNLPSVVFSLKVLRYLVIFLIPVSVLFYGLNFLNTRVVKSHKLRIVFNFSVGMFCFITAFKMFKFFEPRDIDFFCWLGLILLPVLIGFFGYLFYEYLKYKSLKKKDIMFFVLLLSALSVSIKGISEISTGCYGTYSICALIVPFIVFFSRYIIKFCKFLNIKIYYKTLVNICLIVITLFFSLNLKKLAVEKLYPVVTERGIILVPDYLYDARKIVDFIKDNTNKNDVVVSMPEGAMINFLTERDSNNMYYYLIPVNTQLFGVDRIIADFRKNPPDYFILNNLPYTPFNVGNICSYAKNLCDYIEDNYTLVFYTNNALEFYIYKRNLK